MLISLIFLFICMHNHMLSHKNYDCMVETFDFINNFKVYKVIFNIGKYNCNNNL